MKKLAMVMAVAACLMFVATTPVKAQETPAQKPPLKAAIFAQNKANEQLTSKLPLLEDLVIAKLTGYGFSIIESRSALSKFKEVARGGEDDLPAASALGIAKTLGVDYLVLVSFISLGTETREFSGEGTPYKANNKATIQTLRLTLKVLEGANGGIVYADTISVAERSVVAERLKVQSDETINKLIEAAAQKASENISNHIGKIREAKPASVNAVEFYIDSNVAGAVVEIDGVVVGSTPGKFMTVPGIHQMKIYRQWLIPWERTINIFDQQRLNVTLELSKEGLERYLTMERLKEEMAQKRAQTDADVYEKKTKADAEKTNAETEKIKAQDEKAALKIKQDGAVEPGKEMTLPVPAAGMGGKNESSPATGDNISAPAMTNTSKENEK